MSNMSNGSIFTVWQQVQLPKLGVFYRWTCEGPQNSTISFWATLQASEVWESNNDRVLFHDISLMTTIVKFYQHILVLKHFFFKDERKGHFNRGSLDHFREPIDFPHRCYPRVIEGLMIRLD